MGVELALDFAATAPAASLRRGRRLGGYPSLKTGLGPLTSTHPEKAGSIRLFQVHGSLSTETAGSAHKHTL